VAKKRGSWARQRQRAEKRRVLVADLMDGSETERSIAEQLGVGKSTIHRDVAMLEDRWKAQSLVKVETSMARDIHRAESAIGFIWPEVMSANLRAVRELVSLLKYKGDLLGYGPDIAVKSEIEIDPTESVPKVISRITIMRRSDDES